jgi:ferredoxin
MSRVRVGESCIGVGVCESIAPGLFVLGSGERAKVLSDTVTGETLEDAREAALSCPMSAIEID